MSSVSAIRRWFAIAVGAIAAQAVISTSLTMGGRHNRTLAFSSPSVSWALGLMAAVALLSLTPVLWRRGPVAQTPAIAALVLLAAVNVVGRARYSEGISELTLVALLILARGVVQSRPPGSPPAHHPHDLATARAIVDGHGEDSIAPFVVRPDKSFHISGAGLIAYRTIGSTAVISGDPVGPDNAVPTVLESFLDLARDRGFGVVLYGASERHLDLYRSSGLRVMCVGEEAIVDPGEFTLEGRSVRKLRQSVHRAQRCGWEISARDGREIDAALEAEIDQVERTWREKRRRIVGFAMGMGEFESGVGPRDLFVLARAPDGSLRGVMRFVAHRSKLSLDVMRRVGETPNGLNEAMVCEALAIARARAIPQVSLNYAGLAHLIRSEPPGGPLRRAGTKLAISLLGQRFQMERLVRFNDKFAPVWRPRYLVYESRASLPGSILRVLQAEGYLAGPGAGSGHASSPWRQLARSARRAFSQAEGG